MKCETNKVDSISKKNIQSNPNMNFQTQYIISACYCDVTVISKSIHCLTSKFAKTLITSINIDPNQSLILLSVVVINICLATQTVKVFF